MPRLSAIESSEVTGRARELLDAVQARLGMTPNLIRTLAHSPAALQAFLSFGAALDSGGLPEKLREQLALAVAELNGSTYCLSINCALGRAIGLSEEEISDSRQGKSPDSKVRAALQFARKVVGERGGVSDADMARVRRAGFCDGEIAELVAHVALNIFSNYFSLVAGTALDFPPAPEVDPAQGPVT